MLRAPLPTTLNYYLAIHSNDSFWTVQKDQASLSAVLPTTPRRPVQTGRLRLGTTPDSSTGEPASPAQPSRRPSRFCILLPLAQQCPPARLPLNHLRRRRPDARRGRA